MQHQLLCRTYTLYMIILWNSMTLTSFIFTEVANTMKFAGGFLYNPVFTKWRHCVSQNIKSVYLVQLVVVQQSCITRPYDYWGMLTHTYIRAAPAMPPAHWISIKTAALKQGKTRTLLQSRTELTGSTYFWQIIVMKYIIICDVPLLTY